MLMTIVNEVYMCCVGVLIVLLFFFKQKTAYEMRISDWSSDVCSSDLSRSASDRTSPNGRAGYPASPSNYPSASSSSTCRCDGCPHRPQLPIPGGRPAPMPAYVPKAPSLTRRSRRPWQIHPPDQALPTTYPKLPCPSPSIWFSLFPLISIAPP